MEARAQDSSDGWGLPHPSKLRAGRTCLSDGISEYSDTMSKLVMQLSTYSFGNAVLHHCAVGNSRLDATKESLIEACGLGEVVKLRAVRFKPHVAKL